MVMLVEGVFSIVGRVSDVSALVRPYRTKRRYRSARLTSATRIITGIAFLTDISSGETWGKVRGVICSHFLCLLHQPQTGSSVLPGALLAEFSAIPLDSAAFTVFQEEFSPITALNGLKKGLG